MTSTRRGFSDRGRGHGGGCRRDGLHEFFNEAKAEEMRLKCRHPLWNRASELAKRVSGHGDMDFLMDLRWAYYLQNGLPLDMDVYDLATWCSTANSPSAAAAARAS